MVFKAHLHWTKAYISKTGTEGGKEKEYVCLYKGFEQRGGGEDSGKKDHLNRLWHYSQHLDTTIDFHQLQNKI